MSQLTICIIICVLTAISYILGKISMGTTALLSMLAFVVTGCLDAGTAASYFGNTNGIMMLAMLVVAAGFNRTQFVHQCSSSVNRVAKGSLTMMMLGYIVVAIVLSQFIQSSLVVFGIMAPMLAASCDEMGISPSKVMFPLSIACIATVSAFPLGSGATQFAELNGYLEANAYTEYTVGLLDPMKARFPMVIFVAVYCIFFAAKVAPSKPVTAISGVEAKKDNREKLPPLQEKCGYIIFILVTLGLIFQSKLGIDSWVICVAGAVAMVLTGVLSEKEAIASMNMQIGFLFVGSLAMGGALTQTGAGEVIGGALASMVGSLNNPYLIGFAFFIIPFLLTQIMMNRTVMLIFIPIAILACKSMGANPVGIIILTQTACLSSFMTPMSTPAIPMCMAVGGYDLKSLIKQSLIPAAFLTVIAVGWIMTVFPMY
ncbi:MAG TPA: hypothetical protein IAA51_11545 [Candidatus Cottocaccamicrobium excrementipullorum]|nr:hypothetical protein [Candidatus Cottocaccamicrobium excrementipullorum]